MNSEKILIGNHFIPSFLLENFSSTGKKKKKSSRGKKEKVWTFDKEDGTSFLVSSRKIAKQHGFYDYPDEVVGKKIEEDLANIETRASAIISQLSRDQNLHCVDEQARRDLAIFILTLMFRTPSIRIKTDEMDRLFQEHLNETGDDIQNISNYSPLEPGDSDSIGTDLTRNARRHLRLLTEKIWLLVEAPLGSQFYLSDCPVVMTNTLNGGNPLMSTLGLAVKGIEVYLPVTPKHCLAIYCPSVREWACDRYEYLLARKWTLGEPSHINDLLADMALAFRSGNALVYQPENVVFLNYLQVISASRFVFCSTNSFDLATQIVNKNDKFRKTTFTQIV